MPKFSIAIPLYNKENQISKTLNSVLNQSFEDYEVIIVNDGSTDNSYYKVKQFKDKRFKLYEKPNEGVAKTRNKAIELSTGTYIAFLDADDYWEPNHLAEINNLIKDFPAYRWFATAYFKQYSKRVNVKMHSPILETKFERGPVNDFFTLSIVDSLAWTSAVVFEKKFLNELGRFNPTITHGAGEDTDLWIRAAIKSPLVFSKIFTAYHVMYAENRISNTDTHLRQFINLDIYEKYSDEQPGLKKYLDLNRFSIALQYKLSGDLIQFKQYVKKINLSSLNKKQRLLLKLPHKFLRHLLYMKQKLQTNGIYLTAFK
jgi:glycosyltransferase involved in cell wall biosynthesis